MLSVTLLARFSVVSLSVFIAKYSITASKRGKRNTRADEDERIDFLNGSSVNFFFIRVASTHLPVLRDKVVPSPSFRRCSQRSHIRAAKTTPRIPKITQIAYDDVSNVIYQKSVAKITALRLRSAARSMRKQ